MIKLYCDMGADIPKNLLNKYNIKVLTMPISDGSNEYILGENIDKYKLFENMENGIKYTTSQVSFKDFYDNFKKDSEEGHTVIYISLSSGISGAFNTALMAKNQVLEEIPNARIFIEDSRGASIGYGLIVLKIAKFIEKSDNIEEIKKYIDLLVKHTNYIFTVEDLNYLFQGGRLNKTKYVIGSILNVCPILNINKENGKLEMFDKVRGKKMLNKKIKSILSEYLDVLKNQTLFILHGNCLENANTLKNYLSSELNLNNIKIMDLDAIIGCHTGPSILAVIYLDKNINFFDDFNSIEK